MGVAIQEAIRDQILAMTGNHAKNIDVVIDDIKMESQDKDSEALRVERENNLISSTETCTMKFEELNFLVNWHLKKRQRIKFTG